MIPNMKPNTVPNVPADGRKEIPGKTKEPHPRLLPNANAKTPTGVRYLAKPLLQSIFSFAMIHITKVNQSIDFQINLVGFPHQDISSRIPDTEAIRIFSC